MSDLDRPAKSKPLTIGAIKISPWLLLVLPLWLVPVWVIVQAPTPIPASTLIIANTGIALPIVSVGLVFALHSFKQRELLKQFLRERCLLRADEAWHRSVKEALDDSMFGSAGLHNPRSIKCWQDERDPRSQEELIRFVCGTGKSAVVYFAARIRVQPAPEPISWQRGYKYGITLRRTIGKVVPVLVLGLQDVGPSWFRKHWLVRGDLEVAETVLTDSLCELVHGPPIDSRQLWVWRHDSLWLILHGRPTAHGVRVSLEHADRIAELAGIAKQENRPAEPGG
jgi:hypothetical protein